MRLRLIVSEALRSIGSSLSTTVASTMTVLIGMVILGLFIALGTWVVSWTDHVKRELLVNVYFCTDSTCAKRGEATEREINAVRIKLESNRQVKSVDFVSKQEGLELMQKRNPELVANLPSNPLPHKFEIVPTKGEFVDAIGTSLRPLPAGVEKVEDGGKRSDRVLRVAKVIWSIFLVAVIVLLAASTLLIANTIRLSIFARRREIEVMKLVGASNWFVRAPFIVEGLLCGLVGAAAAVVLLLLGKEIALPTILGRVDADSDVQAIPFVLNALILAGTGLVLGAAGAGLTMRRFLKV